MFFGERKKKRPPNFLCFYKDDICALSPMGEGGGRLRKLPHTAHFDYLFVYPIRVVSWVLSFFLPVFCYFNNRSHNLFRVFSSNVKFGCGARKSHYLRRVNSFTDNVELSHSLHKYTALSRTPYSNMYSALSRTSCTNILH